MEDIAEIRKYTAYLKGRVGKDYLDHDDLAWILKTLDDLTTAVENSVPKEILTVFCQWGESRFVRPDGTGKPTIFGQAYDEVMAGTYDGPRLMRAKQLLASRDRVEAERKPVKHDCSRRA